MTELHQEIPRPSMQFVLQNPANFLAFGFGSGLSKKAPGTMGTLAALPLAWLILQQSLLMQFFIIAIAFIIGVWCCGVCAKNLGVHDYGGIVWDEFVGLWITCLFIPYRASGLDFILWLMAAFTLFRIFDIAKPWPIRILDKQVQGGLGIMIDDVAAGIFAGLCLFLALLLVN